MHIIVQKFGGASTRSKETRAIMYKNIIRELENGNKVIVVVSAMGRFDDPYATDTLLAIANITHLSDEEKVRLTTIGENLSSLVCKSELSSLGYQVTTCSHEELQFPIHKKILPVDTAMDGTVITKKLETYDIIICPSMQCLEGDVLVPGMRDVAAVAIGIAVNAKEVELYSEVKGIYTCDPRLVDHAKKLSYITYGEFLELSRNGAKLLNPHCVQLAATYSMPLHVRSAFDKSKGTYIIGDEKIMENSCPFVVSGITGSQNEARITLVNVTTANNSVGQLFEEVANAGINVHVFNQVLVGGGKMDVSFIIDEKDVTTIVEVINNLKQTLNPYRMIIRGNVGKVSVVGVGLRDNQGMFQKVYNTLMKHNINVEMTSSSEINISCYIDRYKVNEAKTILHDIFFKTGGA